MFRRLIILCLFFAFAIVSSALTKIDITRSNISSVPIAIRTFSSNGSSGGDYHLKGFHSVISSDLESCGLFKILDQESHIDEINDLNAVPSFISWRQLQANVLLLVDLTNSNGKLSASFKIWDIFSEKLLTSSIINGDSKAWRRMAHKISDEVYKRMTGEEGYFDTKIAYVSVSGKGKNKIRKLAMMDQDGANNEFLTNGDSIVLTPRFSNDLNHILYFTYADPLRPSIKIYDLNTKKNHSLREFYGMAYAPRYTPDGKSVLLAIEKSGVSNIYSYNLSTMEMKQLTYCTSICTSPSSSPDQSSIVLNSDMGGGRGLYVVGFHGGSPRRISFNKGNYTNPTWSPKGNLIAFTKTLGGNDFYIGIMRPDGSGEKIIAYGRLVEGPSWAPNGKAIVYEKELMGDDGKTYTRLYKIDIVSRKEQEIETTANATDAYWSSALR